MKDVNTNKQLCYYQVYHPQRFFQNFQNQPVWTHSRSLELTEASFMTLHSRQTINLILSKNSQNQTQWENPLSPETSSDWSKTTSNPVTLLLTVLLLVVLLQVLYSCRYTRQKTKRKTSVSSSLLLPSLLTVSDGPGWTSVRSQCDVEGGRERAR